MIKSENTFILASKSETRRKILKNAGLAFDAMGSDFDESELKQRPDFKNRPASEIALALAEAKAMCISKKEPDRIVIGSDQILECDGVFLSKSEDREAARRQLLFLKGKTHFLISASVAVKAGAKIWSDVQTASLTMRHFPDRFLDAYLDQAGDDVLSSVGAYQIEGSGIQLFSDICGDYFTILGLPLLPLLDFLRTLQSDEV